MSSITEAEKQPTAAPVPSTSCTPLPSRLPENDADSRKEEGRGWKPRDRSPSPSPLLSHTEERDFLPQTRYSSASSSPTPWKLERDPRPAPIDTSRTEPRTSAAVVALRQGANATIPSHAPHALAGCVLPTHHNEAPSLPASSRSPSHTTPVSTRFAQLQREESSATPSPHPGERAPSFSLPSSAAAEVEAEMSSSSPLVSQCDVHTSAAVVPTAWQAVQEEERAVKQTAGTSCCLHETIGEQRSCATPSHDSASRCSSRATSQLVPQQPSPHNEAQSIPLHTALPNSTTISFTSTAAVVVETAAAGEQSTARTPGREMWKGPLHDSAEDPTAVQPTNSNDLSSKQVTVSAPQPAESLFLSAPSNEERLAVVGKGREPDAHALDSPTLGTPSNPSPGAADSHAAPTQRCSNDRLAVTSTDTPHEVPSASDTVCNTDAAVVEKRHDAHPSVAANSPTSPVVDQQEQVRGEDDGLALPVAITTDTPNPSIVEEQHNDVAQLASMRIASFAMVPPLSSAAPTDLAVPTLTPGSPSATTTMDSTAASPLTNAPRPSAVFPATHSSPFGSGSRYSAESAIRTAAASTALFSWRETGKRVLPPLATSASSPRSSLNAAKVLSAEEMPLAVSGKQTSPLSSGRPSSLREEEHLDPPEAQESLWDEMVGEPLRDTDRVEREASHHCSPTVESAPLTPLSAAVASMPAAAISRGERRTSPADWGSGRSSSAPFNVVPFTERRPRSLSVASSVVSTTSSAALMEVYLSCETYHYRYNRKTSGAPRPSVNLNELLTDPARGDGPLLTPVAPLSFPPRQVSPLSFHWEFDRGKPPEPSSQSRSTRDHSAVSPVRESEPSWLPRSESSASGSSGPARPSDCTSSSAAPSSLAHTAERQQQTAGRPLLVRPLKAVEGERRVLLSPSSSATPPPSASEDSPHHNAVTMSEVPVQLVNALPLSSAWKVKDEKLPQDAILSSLSPPQPHEAPRTLVRKGSTPGALLTPATAPLNTPPPSPVMVGPKGSEEQSPLPFDVVDPPRPRLALAHLAATAVVSAVVSAGQLPPSSPLSSHPSTLSPPAEHSTTLATPTAAECDEAKRPNRLLSHGPPAHLGGGVPSSAEPHERSSSAWSPPLFSPERTSPSLVSAIPVGVKPSPDDVMDLAADPVGVPLFREDAGSESVVEAVDGASQAGDQKKVQEVLPTFIGSITDQTPTLTTSSATVLPIPLLAAATTPSLPLSSSSRTISKFKEEANERVEKDAASHPIVLLAGSEWHPSRSSDSWSPSFAGRTPISPPPLPQGTQSSAFHLRGVDGAPLPSSASPPSLQSSVTPFSSTKTSLRHAVRSALLYLQSGESQSRESILLSASLHAHFLVELFRCGREALVERHHIQEREAMLREALGMQHRQQQCYVEEKEALERVVGSLSHPRLSRSRTAGSRKSESTPYDEITPHIGRPLTSVGLVLGTDSSSTRSSTSRRVSRQEDPSRVERLATALMNEEAHHRLQLESDIQWERQRHYTAVKRWRLLLLSSTAAQQGQGGRTPHRHNGQSKRQSDDREVDASEEPKPQEAAERRSTGRRSDNEAVAIHSNAAPPPPSPQRQKRRTHQSNGRRADSQQECSNTHHSPRLSSSSSSSSSSAHRPSRSSELSKRRVSVELKRYLSWKYDPVLRRSSLLQSLAPQAPSSFSDSTISPSPTASVFEDSRKNGRTRRTRRRTHRATYAASIRWWSQSRDGSGGSDWGRDDSIDLAAFGSSSATSFSASFLSNSADSSRSLVSPSRFEELEEGRERHQRHRRSSRQRFKRLPRRCAHSQDSLSLFLQLQDDEVSSASVFSSAAPPTSEDEPREWVSANRDHHQLRETQQSNEEPVVFGDEDSLDDSGSSFSDVSSMQHGIGVRGGVRMNSCGLRQRRDAGYVPSQWKPAYYEGLKKYSDEDIYGTTCYRVPPPRESKRRQENVRHGSQSKESSDAALHKAAMKRPPRTNGPLSRCSVNQMYPSAAAPPHYVGSSAPLKITKKKPWVSTTSLSTSTAAERTCRAEKATVLKALRSSQKTVSKGPMRTAPSKATPPPPAASSRTTTVPQTRARPTTVNAQRHAVKERTEKNISTRKQSPSSSFSPAHRIRRRVLSPTESLQQHGGERANGEEAVRRSPVRRAQPPRSAALQRPAPRSVQKNSLRRSETNSLSCTTGVRRKATAVRSLASPPPAASGRTSTLRNQQQTRRAADHDNTVSSAAEETARAEAERVSPSAGFTPVRFPFTVPQRLVQYADEVLANEPGGPRPSSHAAMRLERGTVAGGSGEDVGEVGAPRRSGTGALSGWSAKPNVMEDVIPRAMQRETVVIVSLPKMSRFAEV